MSNLTEQLINLLQKTFAVDQGIDLSKVTDKEVTDSDIVMKAFDDDQRLVLGVVLEPETFDLHKDIYSAQEVLKAQVNFNKHCMQANLGHDVNTDELQITKSFILEIDAFIGDQAVKEGTWLMEMHVSNDDVWKSVKDGGFTGFSVGGAAYHEDLD